MCLNALEIGAEKSVYSNYDEDHDDRWWWWSFSSLSFCNNEDQQQLDDDNIDVYEFYDDDHVGCC